MISRRSLLGSAAAGAALTLAWPGASLRAGAADPAGAAADPRLVLLILRGGLDGLAAVPAYGDPGYRRARGGLAEAAPGDADGVLDLDGFFGLHRRLTGLHSLYAQGELAVLHAIAPPYRGRSHFDGQDVLEAGIPDPAGASDGWLYRALPLLPGAKPAAQRAMALGGAVPLVLSGDHPVASWAPDALPEPDEDTLRRVLALYAEDPLLGPSVDALMETEAMLEGLPRGRTRGDPLAGFVRAAADFLTHPEGPRIAVLESGGWDTHANQAGQLGRRLAGLDGALVELKSGLGAVWQETVLLVVTEFGRTVAMNGTRGSDHGVGGIALAAGGAVAGGRVLADWPGLAPDRLFEGRDLAPTTDTRSLFKTALVRHLGIDALAVDERVFTDRRLSMLEGLIRS